MLLSAGEQTKFRRVLRDPRADSLRKQGIMKRVSALCKRVTTCPHCGALNGQVKKVTGAPSLKVVHELYRMRQADAVQEDFLKQFSAARSHNREVRRVARCYWAGGRGGRSNACSTARAARSLARAQLAQHLGKASEDLHPALVLELFRRIPTQDLDVMWMSEEQGRPEVRHSHRGAACALSPLTARRCSTCCSRTCWCRP